MKLFNRGNDTKAVPAGPAAAVEPAPPAEAPAAPPAPPQPDIAAILDANVKEMSEKISRLATTLDQTAQDRTGFEQKLVVMEERMRKLSALTEMISAQYNPFVGDAPEAESLPEPHVGLAASASTPAPAVAVIVEAPAPPSAEQALHATIEPIMLQPDFAAPLPQDAPANPPAYPNEQAYPNEPAHENGPGNDAWNEAPAHPETHVWAIPDGFESSMVLLSWADMLLKSTPDRQGLQQVIDYYCAIGWLGEPARGRLLAYADGIAHPGKGIEGGDWRPGVEVHEKSLMFVEKLRAIGARKG